MKTQDKAIRTSLNSPVEYVGPQMQHVVNIPIQTVRCKNYALDKHTLNVMSAVKRNVSHITYTITIEGGRQWVTKSLIWLLPSLQTGNQQTLK